MGISDMGALCVWVQIRLFVHVYVIRTQKLDILTRSTMQSSALGFKFVALNLKSGSAVWNQLTGLDFFLSWTLIWKIRFDILLFGAYPVHTHSPLVHHMLLFSQFIQNAKQNFHSKVLPV